MGILKARQRLIGAVLAGLCAAVMLFSPVTAQAQDIKLYEQKIKAGLIYNFLKYTNWPEGTFGDEKRLRVCLFGDDPFDGYLYPLEGRTAQQHVISIEHISVVSETSGCHLVFIHRNKEAHLSDLLAALKGKNVLTVSDMPRFSSRGGMVELSTQKDHRIHLLVNKEAVDQAGLNVQGRMLKLAQLVQ